MDEREVKAVAYYADAMDEVGGAVAKVLRAADGLLALGVLSRTDVEVLRGLGRTIKDRSHVTTAGAWRAFSEGKP